MDREVPPALERALRRVRTFNAPARIVFEAWTRPELFMSLLSCEMDVRVGGTNRLVFRHDAFPEPMAFFGKYLEVTPHSRLVWTNDEGGEDGAVTTVTFEERGAETLVVIRDLYPSKEALDGWRKRRHGSRGTASSGTQAGWCGSKPLAVEWEPFREVGAFDSCFLRSTSGRASSSSTRACWRS
jgi:uncharacterized protein YndB with AHSA1/START domain